MNNILKRIEEKSNIKIPESIWAKVKALNNLQPLSDEYESAIREIFVDIAKITEPDGAVCGFCGKENDSADDLGWFYLIDLDYKIGAKDNKPSRPACSSCESSEIGEHHFAIFGLGER